MQSKKYNSFEPRDSQTREYGDSTSSRNATRTTHTTNTYIDPREGKFNRENYLSKEDSRCVSENVTRSVVKRSVIDKRSTSSYKTREDSKSIKTRDLKGIASVYADPSRSSARDVLHVNGEVKDSPVSSFYSSYSRDKDLSGDRKIEKVSSDAEDVISSFYRSGRDRKIREQNVKNEEESTDSARPSSHVASLSGRDGGSTFVSEADLFDSFGCRGSTDKRVRIDETANSARGRDVSNVIDLEDTNIRRRSLERKQASNSLQRERLTKRLSVEDSSDPLKHISSTYLSLSDKWKKKDSGPSKMPLGNPYDRDLRLTDSEDIDAVHYKGKMRSRSLSLETLDDEERSRLGIYRELPGRKEFLSYAARTKADEEKEMSRGSRCPGSLERDAQRTRRERRDSLLRLRSKSTDELRSLNRDDNEMYSRDRSEYLHRRGNTEWHRTAAGDVAGRQGSAGRTLGSYSPRKEPSTHAKLREDIARLKAETDTSSVRKSEIFSPYSENKRPSTQDKLKEDIAKLKAETLTREHIKPFIPPSSSSVGSRNHSYKSEVRQPTLQDKLREGIAKLKAETRDFPSLSRKASDMATHKTIPENNVEERRDVRQSGVNTSSYERYAYSNRDGNVLKDEMRSKNTQRYGDPADHKYVYTKHEDRRFGANEDEVPGDDRTHSDMKFTDDYFMGSSGDYLRPTSAYDDPSLRSDERSWKHKGLTTRKPEDGWPREDERELMEGEDSKIYPRSQWDEPLRTSREGRRGSTQGYATKRVFRADSTMSMTSTKNSEHGPSSVRGFFHGSVSEEDQSAYYSKEMGDKEDSYSREPFRTPERSRSAETFRQPESFRKRESPELPEPDRQSKSHWRTDPLSTTQPTRQSWPYRTTEPSTSTARPRQKDSYRTPDSYMMPDGAIPLPCPGTRNRQDSIVVSSTDSKYEPTRTAKEEKEVISNQVQTSREFVTRKATREDSVISRKSITEDVGEMPSKVNMSRRFSELSGITPRATTIREEAFTPEGRVISPEEIVETIQEYKDSKSSAMSELKKKIDQLKNKVDELDDSKSRGRLERYVDEHSEKRPDVEIKDPVHIPRYQPSARKPQRGSVIDDAEVRPTRVAADSTSETISRQISRHTSIASTTRRISSIREGDLPTSPPASATDEGPEEVFPKEDGEPQKPDVLAQMRDAETMTTPDVQEQVGTDRYQRLDSTITEIVDEPYQIEELRGVPIGRRGTEAKIQEVTDTGDETDSAVTTIHIDTEQQPLSPRKDKQRWWNAFTAEDVDRLLEIGDWGRPNAYTAEDMDKLWHLGPARRRSFRRGSYERSSFRRRPRRSGDDLVDVHVRVRGRQEKRSRPQCIIAQAAPEEKAIVLRESKESADPYIRKIKVDDVYGADAVRVENGIVKIKVGDLSTRGRKAWARILQQKDRIVESDGTVTIPVSRDQYEDGIYYTNYYDGEDQDGTIRIPIRFKIQEDDRVKARKMRNVRDIKRAGSMKRRRRAAGSRAYIVGARYYHGNMLMSAGSHGSQAHHQGMVVRRTRDSSRVAANEIVLRGNQPYTVPMKTIQRIHVGHKVTRQATSVRNEDGKMVITVHAIPPRPPKFNLQQVGVNMAQTSGRLTSDSFYDSTAGRRGAPSTSRSYLINSGSRGGHTSRGYTTYASSGQQGTSYIVTDPSDSYPRRPSRLKGVTRLYNSNEVSCTPTIVPYEDDSQTGNRTGNYSDSFIADPSSFYYAPGSRITTFDPRINARTAYGERFNVKDYGDISKVQYLNGTRENSRIINDRRWANRRFKYGTSWNSKQHENLNGRTMSWAVEEVAPDF